MSVRVRLKKCFNSEGYNIIVTSKGQLKGRLLEIIGYYSLENSENFLQIDMDRLGYWLEKGAKCSERVLKITRIYNNESFR